MLELQHRKFHIGLKPSVNPDLALFIARAQHVRAALRIAEFSPESSPVILTFQVLCDGFANEGPQTG
jgi:hypothetical protein